MTAVRAALIVALLCALITRDADAQSDEIQYSPPLREALAAYRAGDLVAAERMLRTFAPGDSDAEAWLGVLLLERGQNTEALKALQHAADGGSSEADHRLGLVFAEGQAGVSRDDQHAAELFEKAAKAGHRRAEINLGILYLRGQGVTRDLVQARAWLEKAAAGDDPDALYALGRAMEQSEGQAIADPVRAADSYRRAAEKGHGLAALRFGLALNDGYGVKRDLAAAQRWLIQAQKSGVPEAALALADMAARMTNPRDKAANEKVVQLAVSWYEVAARAGVPSAQFKLANAYFAGAGVERDVAQAKLWYLRAAKQGLAEAQHALGILLIGGVGGPPDPVEGYKWLVLAEQGGDPDTHDVREKAKQQLPENDRIRAEDLAKSFKPALERPVDDAVPRLASSSKQ